jgi:hypothetical protein
MFYHGNYILEGCASSDSVHHVIDSVSMPPVVIILCHRTGIAVHRYSIQTSLLQLPFPCQGRNASTQGPW